MCVGTSRAKTSGFDLHSEGMYFYYEILKVGRVIPIFKSGDSKNITNYRPISTLLTINKIFEKLLHNRLVCFFEPHDIINEYQFGFRKNKSTSLAIFHLVKDISLALNKKMYTICLFLDLRKAFDSVSHEVLIDKLQCYGIRGVVLNLIKSYLTNRRQYTQWKDKTSKLEKVKLGVPIGSILGPFLFNAFINDICNLPGARSISYADDAVFYISSQNLNECIESMNDFIVRLSSWLKNNMLNPNISKTKVMMFGSSFNKINLPIIYFDNSPIEWVNSFNYLGFDIDDKLLYRNHVDKVISKISVGHGVIYRLSNFMPQHMLISIFYALIYPHLTNNVIVWGGGPPSRLDKVKIAVNKVLRTILRVKYDYNHVPLTQTAVMYKSLGILPFEYLYKFCIGIFCYSVLYGSNSNLFNDIFAPNLASHHYATRSTCFNIPSFRLDVEKHGTIYNCIKTMNDDIPNELFHPMSLSVFKKKLKQHFIELIK